MKNTIYSILTCLSVPVILAVLASTSNPVMAQEKGGASLMKYNQSQASTVSESSDSKSAPMSCSKCKDAVKHVAEGNMKGGWLFANGNGSMKTISQHQCEGCSTTFKTVGLGKAQKEIAQHSCSTGKDSNSCCGKVKTSKPVQGM